MLSANVVEALLVPEDHVHNNAILFKISFFDKNYTKVPAICVINLVRLSILLVLALNFAKAMLPQRFHMYQRVFYVIFYKIMLYNKRYGFQPVYGF